jgi:16S rRNA G527 N7-methylase RsmG
MLFLSSIVHVRVGPARGRLNPSVAMVTTSNGASGSAEHLLHRCEVAFSHLDLGEVAAERASRYVSELLRYNERTNVYSKAAYDKLPFHVADSLTLAALVRSASPHGVLDLGSGSGLPSVLMACVNPDIPVFAVESKSRKTRFLTRVGKALALPNYVPLTQNVNELSRSWCFDVDVVTAKAFKPLPEVAPIARRCIQGSARMLIPISDAQVVEFGLVEEQLERQGDNFLYYAEALEASHGTAQRNMASVENTRAARL